MYLQFPPPPPPPTPHHYPSTQTSSRFVLDTHTCTCIHVQGFTYRGWVGNWVWVHYVDTHKTYHSSYHARVVYIVAITGRMVTKRCVISTISKLIINKTRLQYDFHECVSPKVTGG